MSVKIAEFQESKAPQFDLFRTDLPACEEKAPRGALESLLHEAISSHALATKKVIVNFQSEFTLFKYLELPRLAPRELAVALPIEAQKYFPWPLQDTILTYVEVPPLTGDRERMGVTFSAVSKKPFQQTVEGIKSASLPSADRSVGKVFTEGLKRYRLNPAVMEIPAMALCRANIHNHGVIADKTLGLINVGGQFTNLVILKGEYIYFARDLLMGGGDLTKALMQGDRLSLSRAEEAKRALDLSSSPDFSILPAIEKWSREITYSIEFYRNRLTDATLPLDRIILSGGGALLKGLPAYLEGLLKVPVELDAVKRVSIRSVNGAAPPPDTMLHFKTALGLAMRGTEK